MSTILVVEDESYIRQFVTLNLKARGYTIISAESAEEGLQLLREYNPQALILDIKLPGMSGWSMLNAVDDDPTLSKLPVIVMTASSVLSQPDEYRYSNIVQKLIKPIGVSDLIKAVSAIFVSNDLD